MNAIKISRAVCVYLHTIWKYENKFEKEIHIIIELIGIIWNSTSKWIRSRSLAIGLGNKCDVSVKGSQFRFIDNICQ